MVSQKVSRAVTPAKAGVHKWLSFLDSRFRGNDENRCFLTFYEFIMIKIMSKHTAGTKYILTGERRYLRFSARVNEAADDLLKIQMTKFLNFRHFSSL